jgi:hypothetical protein
MDIFTAGKYLKSQTGVGMNFLFPVLFGLQSLSVILLFNINFSYFRLGLSRVRFLKDFPTR